MGKPEICRDIYIEVNPTTVIRPLGSTERDISVDPTLDEILSMWPPGSVEGPLKIGPTGPAELQHAALLYRYRNYLVHEFRVPGRGWDVTKEGEPFYQKMTDTIDFLPVSERWELVYPLAFPGILCRNSLAALAVSLRHQSRNPFDTFLESSFWVRVDAAS